MNHGILGWKTLINLGFALVLLALIFGPSFILWGRPAFVWVIWAGLGSFVAGVVSGVFLAVTGRIAPSRPVGRGGFYIGSHGEKSSFRATSKQHRYGPAFNVDGTPMQDSGGFDVAGKAYGDSGTSHHSETGSGMFGSGMSSSNMSGSDW